MRLRISAKQRWPRCGFTLTDLVVVAGGVSALIGLMLPGLAKAAKSGEAAVCLNNLRQIARASQIYAADNDDKFPGAYHGGFEPGTTAERPWATGWLDWTTRSDNTNTLFVSTTRYASLSPYLGYDPHLVKCPADRYVSLVQRRLGWAERARSISVNVAVGEGNAESGPWDLNVFKHVRRISEILFPSPAETWLFQDEHPDSINDPCFFPPYKTSWMDVPASYHSGAGGVAFVDGRTELRRWRGSTIGPVEFAFRAPVPIEQQDIDWIRYRTPRVSERY